MKKFLLGFVTCWYFTKHLPEITKFVEGLTAKLELRQDILLHDNPDLREGE